MSDHGFLLIDKPIGLTSHDVVHRLRKITGIRRIGHAGTLDPFASGLLLVAVSREATKHISSFSKMDKMYSAEIVLGATTESFDPELPEILVPIPEGVDANTIKQASKALTGPQQQIPPMHSAIKVKGKKLYELARKGEEIERPPRAVEIFLFDIDSIKNEEEKIIVQANIHVSSGTYIRAIARDLGLKLGTGSYLRALRRTTIGKMKIEDAVTLESLTPENWRTSLQSLNTLLD